MSENFVYSTIVSANYPEGSVFTDTIEVAEGPYDQYVVTVPEWPVQTEIVSAPFNSEFNFTKTA